MTVASDRHAVHGVGERVIVAQDLRVARHRVAHREGLGIVRAPGQAVERVALGEDADQGLPLHHQRTPLPPIAHQLDDPRHRVAR